MRKPGKRIGTCVYVHRLYRAEVIPDDVYQWACDVVGGDQDDHTCLKYDRKTGNVTFQWSPDFDTAPEPIVGKCVLAQANGTMKVMMPSRDPMIWHHKWMWVKDDYSGFDVEESKARSALWTPHVSGEEKKRIGRKSFWDSIRNRWE